MPPNQTPSPTRRADAERNRDKILAAARTAFADPDAEVSMAEISRRAGVGMATLYRNFPGPPRAPRSPLHRRSRCRLRGRRRPSAARRPERL